MSNIKNKVSREQEQAKKKINNKAEDKREDFFKKEEKLIQKTLYLTEKQDKTLQMHRALNGENNSEATRKALNEYLNKYDNLKQYLNEEWFYGYDYRNWNNIFKRAAKSS